MVKHKIKAWWPTLLVILTSSLLAPTLVSGDYWPVPKPVPFLAAIQAGQAGFNTLLPESYLGAL